MKDKKGDLKGKQGPMKLMFRDSQYEYISLPEEAGGGVVRLRRWLHCMRPAASTWEDYAENLKQNGYERRLAAPTAFVNKEWCGERTSRSWPGTRN